MDDKYYKVEGHAGLAKNPVTGTIINTNTDEIRGARKRKLKKRELQREVGDLRKQVDKLTSIIEQLVEK